MYVGLACYPYDYTVLNEQGWDLASPQQGTFTEGTCWNQRLRDLLLCSHIFSLPLGNEVTCVWLLKWVLVCHVHFFMVCIPDHSETEQLITSAESIH